MTEISAFRDSFDKQAGDSSQALLSGATGEVSSRVNDGIGKANGGQGESVRLGFPPVLLVDNARPRDLASDASNHTEAKRVEGKPHVDVPKELHGQQAKLYEQFYPALTTYHTGGRSNGGAVDGVQLPPKVSEHQLNAYMQKLATFLAKDPGLDEKEPAPGELDKDFRHRLESEAASDVKANSDKYIPAGLALIQNDEIRAMVKLALDQAPEKFATAPSSSSGRFHPADEVNEGGLRLHSVRSAIMGAKVIDFFNQEAKDNVIGNQKIVGDQRDLIVGALLVHDIAKGGVPWNKYDAAHGPLGRSFLREVWETSPHQDFAQTMSELVGNHMAQWNRAPRTEAAAPRPPKDLPDQIVSYGDYLGAQANVFVQVFPGKDH